MRARPRTSVLAMAPGIFARPGPIVPDDRPLLGDAPGRSSGHTVLPRPGSSRCRPPHQRPGVAPGLVAGERPGGVAA